jgi:hypothetical protein
VSSFLKRKNLKTQMGARARKGKLALGFGRAYFKTRVARDPPVVAGGRDRSFKICTPKPFEHKPNARRLTGRSSPAQRGEKRRDKVRIVTVLPVRRKRTACQAHLEARYQRLEKDTGRSPKKGGLGEIPQLKWGLWGIPPHQKK